MGPGFRFSVASYVVSLLRPEIIRELELRRHGLELLPLDGTFTPLDGDYLWRPDDKAACHREIARHARADADAYGPFNEDMAAMAAFVKPILGMTPPDPKQLDIRGMLDAFSLARQFRALPRRRQQLLVPLLSAGA